MIADNYQTEIIRRIDHLRQEIDEENIEDLQNISQKIDEIVRLTKDLLTRQRSAAN